jgi:hypothetical protein
MPKKRTTKKRTTKATPKVSKQDTNPPKTKKTRCVSITTAPGGGETEPKFKDERGRWVKIGSRVRGKFLNYDLETHGHVREIYETEKYGTVCAIIEKQGNINNILASNVRRMYGDTQATKATKTVKKKKAAKKKVRRKNI